MGLFSRQQSSTEARSQSRPVSKRAARARTNDGGEPLDPAESHKRRARRRLIGATALVLGVVVFLPMVFDRGPKPLSNDIVVQIPEKDSAFNPPPATKPAPAVVKVAPEAAAVPEAPPEPAMKAEKSAERTEKAAAAPTSSPQEAARALAVLEGQSDNKPTAAEPAKSATERHSVQVGSFASTEKVKDLRAKLSVANLQSYVEVINTPQGERTRVRLGPYPSKDAAEKARELLKKRLVLDGTVVSGQ